MALFLRVLLVIFSLSLSAGAAASDLPVPRFASIRSEIVNARTGPGPTYPIRWVYKRQGLPVEIIAEYSNWRKIRDSDGDEGWVHERMLSGKRSALVKGKNIQNIFHLASDQAVAIVRAEPGVLVRIKECNPRWCRVEAQGNKGWMSKDALWGVYPDEVLG